MTRKIAGIVLVVIGFVALVTPFTPGSWLMLVGLELLGFELVFVTKTRTFMSGRCAAYADQALACLEAAFIAFLAGLVGYIAFF
jgi:hypothetical protein